MLRCITSQGKNLGIYETEPFELIFNASIIWGYIHPRNRKFPFQVLSVPFAGPLDQFKAEEAEKVEERRKQQTPLSKPLLSAAGAKLLWLSQSTMSNWFKAFDFGCRCMMTRWSALRIAVEYRFVEITLLFSFGGISSKDKANDLTDDVVFLFKESFLLRLIQMNNSILMKLRIF